MVGCVSALFIFARIGAGTALGEAGVLSAGTPAGFVDLSDGSRPAGLALGAAAGFVTTAASFATAAALSASGRDWPNKRGSGPLIGRLRTPLTTHAVAGCLGLPVSGFSFVRSNT